MTNQVITEANGGVWTFAKADSPYNSARVGRFHDLQFLQEGSSTPGQMARAGVITSSGWTAAGSPAGLFVSPTGTGLGIQANAGSGVIERGTFSGPAWSSFTPALTGPYMVHLRSTGTLAANTASTSSTRIDRVDYQLMDGPGFGDNGGVSLAQLIYTAGTAGSGVAANAPANSIPCSVITIPANTATLTSAMFTDTRRSAGFKGAVRPMLPGDALADVGFTHGEMRDTTILPGAVDEIDRWNAVTSTWQRVMDLTFAAASQTLLFTAITSTATAFTVPTAWTTPTQQGIVFVAPASGIVKIDYTSRIHTANPNGFATLAPVIKTGVTIGSGTVVQAATTDYGLQTPGVSTSDQTTSSWITLTGLTPGNAFNCQLAAETNATSGTATYTSTRLVATPVNF